MKILKIDSNENRVLGEMEFKMRCHYEDILLRDLSVECYEDGVEVGKILAKVIKHDSMESSPILKRSYFNNRLYMYRDFLDVMSIVFDDGPRLRLSDSLRRYGRNVMIVQDVFLYRGERYVGQASDINSRFCTATKEYIFMHKDL
ncbi:TPA: hypothetical protein VDT37_001795 [Pseudomonas aeruginosa]|nr:hypothetical protein [Pseudomonas aeruginosa]